MNKKLLSKVLAGVFAVAMIMGPGPGLRLVNPDDSPDARFTVAGLPIIYVWGLFWYAVQLAVVVTAYFTVWNEESEENGSEEALDA